METEGLRQVTKKMVNMEEEAWEAFRQRLSIRKLKKNEILWSIGDVCKDVGFITKGMMRYFFYRDETEVTGQFFFENTFVTTYGSLISGKPTDIAWQALEDVELLMVSREVLYKLFDEYKSWERFGRLMAEQTVVSMQRTRTDLTSATPKEKYLQLIKERPKVIERVPLQLIASYLNMTPEHLSRVRREVAEKNL